MFDAGNRFNGVPFCGVPHHCMDVYFLLRTLHTCFPTQKLKNISEAHSRMWLEFAN